MAENQNSLLQALVQSATNYQKARIDTCNEIKIATDNEKQIKTNELNKLSNNKLIINLCLDMIEQIARITLGGNLLEKNNIGSTSDKIIEAVNSINPTPQNNITPLFSSKESPHILKDNISRQLQELSKDGNLDNLDAIIEILNSAIQDLALISPELAQASKELVINIIQERIAYREKENEFRTEEKDLSGNREALTKSLIAEIEDKEKDIDPDKKQPSYLTKAQAITQTLDFNDGLKWKAIPIMNDQPWDYEYNIDLPTCSGYLLVNEHDVIFHQEDRKTITLDECKKALGPKENHIILEDKINGFNWEEFVSYALIKKAQINTFANPETFKPENLTKLHEVNIPEKYSKIFEANPQLLDSIVENLSKKHSNLTKEILESAQNAQTSKLEANQISLRGVASTAPIKGLFDEKTADITVEANDIRRTRIDVSKNPNINQAKDQENKAKDQFFHFKKALSTLNIDGTKICSLLKEQTNTEWTISNSSRDAYYDNRGFYSYDDTQVTSTEITDGNTKITFPTSNPNLWSDFFIFILTTKISQEAGKKIPDANKNDAAFKSYEINQSFYGPDFTNIIARNPNFVKAFVAGMCKELSNIPAHLFEQDGMGPNE